MVMLEAVRDFRDATGRQIGVKPAGGMRTTKDAIKHLVVVNETAGEDWPRPEWFRMLWAMETKTVWHPIDI